MLGRLGEHLERMGRGSEKRLIAIFMLAGASLSIVMNNIAAGSMLLPVALAACRRSRISPARVLLPLSYGILLGGMCTLFTTANLVVGGILDSYNLRPLTMVEFLHTGGCLLVVGVLYMVTVGRHLLPTRGLSLEENQAPDLLKTYGLYEHMFEVELEPTSSFVGQSLRTARIGNRFKVSVLAVFRGTTAVFDPPTYHVFEAGDVVLLLGTAPLVALMEPEGARLVRGPGRFDRNYPVSLAEVIVAPRSQVIGSDLIRLRMRDRFGVTVVGLWRQGVSHLSDVSYFPLQAGDALLVVGTQDRFVSLSHSTDFLVPEMPVQMPMSVPRAALVLIVSVVSMSLAAKGLLPLAVSMLTGGALLVATRCLTMEQAYQGVEWNIIVLIAAMAPVGAALSNCGLATGVAHSLQGLASHGPRAFAMANYLLAVVVTQVIGGQVASLVVGPLAVASAFELGPGIHPHTVGLVVALGCSTAFMTPIAHPVNVLMMGPGGYTAGDFLKIGVPLTVLCTLTMGLMLLFSPVL